MKENIVSKVVGRVFKIGKVGLGTIVRSTVKAMLYADGFDGTGLPGSWLKRLFFPDPLTLTVTQSEMVDDFLVWWVQKK